MKKLLITLFIGIFSLAGCSFNENSDNSSQNEYNSTRTSYNNIISNNDYTPPPEEKKPEEISHFSTKIYDKSSGRQNNIQITVSKLNGTIVKPGEEFSFCSIVGKATAEKGYEKAKIFDKDGNVLEGYRWR